MPQCLCLFCGRPERANNLRLAHNQRIGLGIAKAKTLLPGMRLSWHTRCITIIELRHALRSVPPRAAGVLFISACFEFAWRGQDAPEPSSLCRPQTS